MILIKNGYIKTMTGSELKNGCILLGDDGKIAAIAESIAAPAGATVIDAEGRLVTPGCVESHCHIGVDEKPDGLDHNERSDTVCPQMQAIDSFNPQTAVIAEAVEGGVTTVCTGVGSANVMGGTFAAIKLAGDRVDDMILKHPVAIKCAFGENPRENGKTAKKAPQSRMGTASVLRDILRKGKKYYEDKQEGKSAAFDAKLEALLPLFAKEIPLKAHVHRADDIFTAIRIAKEFDLRLTLDHCTDGALIADTLAKEGYPVIVGPGMGVQKKAELLNKGYGSPAVMHKAGLLLAITTDSPVIEQQYLPLCAGLAAAEGLPMEEAWKSITINPAVIMGIADRVGSLEVGKDADVVIWTADPLTCVGGCAYTTIIDGKVVWQA